MDAALRDHRLLVADLRLVGIRVLESVVLAEERLDVDALEIRRPALLDPHVRDVGGRHRVAEPLVRALVDDDEIEFRRDADTCPVAFQISIFKQVSVGYGTLMFHT